ncbi:PilN domain-containing protein [Pseudoxanthomonas indica]|uniref:General secretion pathway protein L n=1 Tax=Pseudoxanthomonas indica TaxID=428993 RepID=A0A1T5LFH3_9GAMM|nr:PilN domain-containing protein [Pseudoxanthomonas indica]GGD34526.1 type II secretion system protein L [Pseudoxanthomonas indica]SKC74710.1 general secretion pathway protein L [Pseudoxanthomonas indica]
MNTYRDSLDTLRTRLWPRAGGWLSWWGTALASWLPQRWRALLGLTRDRLLLRPLGDELYLQWHNTDGVRDLAQVPLPLDSGDLDRLLGKRLADLPRWLLLPAGSALRRPLVLPAAAADRLRDVVRFEIDRQTPFSADSVRFDACLRQRRDDGQLDVELVAMPRARFDAAMAPLGDLAAVLSGVDVADANGRPLGVNLLPDNERRQRQTSLRAWQWALAAIALLALLFGGWKLLDNRRQAADALEASLRASSGQARLASAQRQQLIETIDGINTLDRARAQRPTALEVLDELARRLPDSTYLEKVSMEGDQLVLIGLSTEASSLVGKLQGSPLWRSPALSGAVQPDQALRRDRFTLTAQLVGTAPASAAATTGAPSGERAD